MKFVSDFLSLLLFFAVYIVGESKPELAQDLAGRLLGGFVRGGVIPPDLASLLLAIAVAIIASAIQIAVLLAIKKRVGVMQWVVFGMLVVFGGASIYFHSDTFIKWKVTVLYWLFGTVLLVSNTFFGKNLIRALMEPNGMELPDRAWERLNLSWIGFFSLIGAVNLYIAFHFSRTTWVTFKSFGLTGATIVFAVVQGLLISRYLDRVDADAGRAAALPGSERLAELGALRTVEPEVPEPSRRA